MPEQVLEHDPTAGSTLDDPVEARARVGQAFQDRAVLLLQRLVLLEIPVDEGAGVLAVGEVEEHELREGVDLVVVGFVLEKRTEEALHRFRRGLTVGGPLGERLDGRRLLFPRAHHVRCFSFLSGIHRGTVPREIRPRGASRPRSKP